MLPGCMNRTSETTDADSLRVDTLATDTVDSLSKMVDEMPIPASADELFDDFFFTYAASRKVQNSRTLFPLKVMEYGKASVIEKQQWKVEHFFMKQGYYTLIFNGMRQLNSMKDTTVNNVIVERINMVKSVVKQWHFLRSNGQWKLTDIKVMPLKEHADAAFLSFYQKFSSNAEFQQASLAETVTFTGPDPEDDFSTMTGEILPEQWPMFAPQLPTGTIYNIVYGVQEKTSSSIRYFLIRGIANGLQTDLTFMKTNGKWELTQVTT
ncbi:MAG: DUF4348 domain-containing protein [Prevotella sp.]|nr:DUF4348 domain-containing protein [Prevotella sp.]